MAGEKSAGKSAGAPGVPFQKGSDPRQGRGPAKGAPNAGRPRKEYVEWWRKVLNQAKTRKAVKKILTDANHQHFASILRMGNERAYGKPVQPLSGPQGEPLIPRGIRVELVKPVDATD